MGDGTDGKSKDNNTYSWICCIVRWATKYPKWRDTCNKIFPNYYSTVASNEAYVL